MNLQTILYGQFTPPPAINIRRHTILYEGKNPPLPYKHKTPKPNTTDEFSNKMFELIQAHPGICVKEITETLKKAPSYIYRMRDILFEQNKIYGVRGKPIRRGGPVTTLLYARDHAG